MTEPLYETIQRKYTKGAHKAVTPKDASSILLIDNRRGGPKVLMGRRNPAAKFMPGVFVFPGGRVERGDGDAPHAGSLAAADLTRLGMLVQRPTERKLRGLALAAIRETFEETGLRLGTPAVARPTVTPEGWEEFLANGDVPNLDGVRFVSRAITPPGRNRRFDTRFFMRDVSSAIDLTTVKPTPESELVELVWVPLADSDAIETVEITQIILKEIRALAQANFAEDIARPMFRMRNGKFQRVAL